ncbi:MAG: ParB N-terminal domain-containing protein, partial [Clostridia bacterium]|nr:ParB N-terminal domain-containing protein [Clostridia bacterium]
MSDTTEKKYDDYVFVSSEEVSMLDPTIIKTASPFKDLFPVREAELDRVVESMKADGYDSAHPIILWAGHNVTVVDGHTRLAAAKKLLFAQIPVIHKEFKDEAEALEYAIKSQRNRRNLTDADLLRCVTELDKRMKEGRPGKTATNLAVNGRSSENTAKLLGTSRGKVEKIRTINDHASDEVKEAVKS